MNIRPIRVRSWLQRRRSRGEDMTKEADNLVPRLLREIRKTQHEHTKKFDEPSKILVDMDQRLNDLYKTSTHTLGVAANAHSRYETLTARVDRLVERVKRLEAKHS
jgi:polyhydroxyalkanoate synthesis regulator phasin